MDRRFVSIWFCHLLTDWFVRRNPSLGGQPFVLTAPDHGKMRVTATSTLAQSQGVHTGMAVADARALVSRLQVIDDPSGLPDKLLAALGNWFIRYSPCVAIQLPDGLIIDASGCTHLWGSEDSYLNDMLERLQGMGYEVRAGMAGTVGAAWAVARYGDAVSNIASGDIITTLMALPPSALRLDTVIVEKMAKLGLCKIGSFIRMPRSALQRRFGKDLLQKLDQALGYEHEAPEWLHPPDPYQERLLCIEPIVTATGIEIAIQQLLSALCDRLKKEGKGLRTCKLSGFRVDGQVQQILIGTNRPTHNVSHLFKLFELKIPAISPGLGIELFLLEASRVENISTRQEALWNSADTDEAGVAELLDRLTNKMGEGIIHRYLPQEHHWPERSIKPVTSLDENPTTSWKLDRPRPIYLLPRPEPVTVSAPIPDYPPMLFQYKGRLHRIKKADGPERIEREWWLEGGEHRDYYRVEDEEGRRYWIFRLGHYGVQHPPQWYIHGFFM